MSSQVLVCTQCGYVGKPKRLIKGNGLIEIILWLFLIVPGLIYSIWRSSSRYNACPVCKSTNLIPPSSPKAKGIIAESTSIEEVDKLVESSKQSRYQDLSDWCSEHWLLSIILVLFIIPFGLIILSNIIRMMV